MTQNTPNIVTRFAPSPTGFLHIGGARTALFNWLFAKHHNGKMLLRIEDTDRKRHTEGATEAILDGLNWLGINWDDEPISQFARSARHKEIAEALVDSGKAYKCYASQEELSAMREKARANGGPSYDGTWRDKDQSEAPADIEPVIRIKSELNGVTVIEDAVQGRIEFANKDMDDFIILRSDGTPTYMLAVVVDDHDMAVTHIIRGDDHLTNAARQSLIYRAMNWEVPVFAHIPLIHGPDGAKLSKRHGALGAEAYRAMGYLPEALTNYLVRLGWSKGDEEIISKDNLIAWFSLDGIGKAPSRFDLAKLDAINAHYIKAMEDSALVELLEQSLQYLDQTTNTTKDVSAPFATDTKALLIKAMPTLKERAKTLVELLERANFVYQSRPFSMTEKADKLLTDEARSTLQRLAEKLTMVDDWSHDPIDKVVRLFAEQEGLKLGKIGQPLRAALTGTTEAPGIFDVLLILGKNESIARIRDCKA